MASISSLASREGIGAPREVRAHSAARLGSGFAGPEVAVGNRSNLTPLAGELSENGFVFGLELSTRMRELVRRKLKDLP